MSYNETILVKINNIESTIKVIEGDIRQTVAILECLRDSYSKLKFYKRKMTLVLDELRILKADLKTIKEELQHG